jgi:sterol desaturase/sphingolipid hydroxylase (fatty acid hydroxylase superfamily)
MSDTLTDKQAQFNAAMERYARMPVYRWTGRVTSLVNVALQIGIAVLVLPQSIGPIRQWLTLLAAYVLADFVNGWVHLYMDNSDNYDSATGPFFASFHLHHRTPRYRRRPLLLVYYQESGSKLWLAIVEMAMITGIRLGVFSGVVAYLMLYFAVLSSVAEVCHYRCHVAQTKFGRLLGSVGIILSSRYHARHHREDNVQYAFLNGMTDPLLNLIARKFYPGYKITTDRHYARFVGTDTKNRS